MKKSGRIFFLVFILAVILSSYSVSAKSRDYTVENGMRVPMPQSYILDQSIYIFTCQDGTGLTLNAPEDLFYSSDRFLYIADTGNNRIIKSDTAGNVVKIYDSDGEKKFKSPKGVFVDQSGLIYVADTGNSRLSIISQNGEKVSQILRPQSSMLDENFSFAITKVCVTPTGMIYVLSGETVMTLDKEGEFKGFLGQNQIGFDLREALYRLIATEKQQQALLTKRLAAIYNNIFMDDSGMLYACTNDEKNGEIKKINSTGKNTLKSSTGYFGERRDVDGSITGTAGKTYRPAFSDVSVGKNGIVSAVDLKSGKVYQYSQEGEMLSVFGGLGSQSGMFGNPVSLITDEESKIFVLDKDYNNIQVFSPTKFIRDVYQAVTLYESGDYAQSGTYWEEVLQTDANYKLAHIGLGRVAYKNKEYADSMREYRLAQSKADYSKAFSKNRHELFRENFYLVLLLACAAVAAVLLLFKLYHKIVAKAVNAPGNVNMMRAGLLVMKSPRDSFEILKLNRSKVSWLPAVITFVLTALVRIVYVMGVNFPLSSIEPAQSNMFLEIVKILALPLTWILAIFLVTSIADGETKLKEITVATGFCMVPYVVFTLPAALLSQILCLEEAGLYHFLQAAIIAWVVILAFLSVMRLNNYSFSRTLGLCIVGIFMTLLIWGVGILFFGLIGQVYSFISGILLEIRMSFI